MVSAEDVCQLVKICKQRAGGNLDRTSPPVNGTDEPRIITHSVNESNWGKNSFSLAILSMFCADKSIDVKSSQYGSKGCTSVMTWTRRSWATPNEHSVRNVASVFLAAEMGAFSCGRENTLLETSRLGLVLALFALRALSGCSSSVGGRPELLAFEGELSSRASPPKS